MTKRKKKQDWKLYALLILIVLFILGLNAQKQEGSYTITNVYETNSVTNNPTTQTTATSPTTTQSSTPNTTQTPTEDTGVFSWIAGLFPDEDEELLVVVDNTVEPQVIIPEGLVVTTTPQMAYDCFDSDATVDDAMVQGFCKDQTGAKYDTCGTRGNTLTEYYCRSGACVSRSVTCGYCSEGACQYPQ